MVYRQLIVTVLFVIGFNHSFAQKTNICGTVDNYQDSMVLQYLVSYFPGDSISNKQNIVNGKIQQIRKQKWQVFYK